MNCGMRLQLFFSLKQTIFYKDVKFICSPVPFYLPMTYPGHNNAFFKSINNFSLSKTTPRTKRGEAGLKEQFAQTVILFHLFFAHLFVDKGDIFSSV